MDADTERMTAELADELASNTYRTKLVDPRDVPWRHHNLRAVGQSAAHCFESFQVGKEQTLAMRLGTGTHALCFGRPVALWDQPAAKGSGKAPRNGKAWDSFRSLNSHATILSATELARATSVAQSLKSHEDASRLMFSTGVLHESPIWWQQAGRRRQSTPDAYCPSYVAELKTTRCAEPSRFARDAMYRGYHAQVADQMDAVEAATGARPAAGYIIAVETVKPYVVTVLQLTERALEQGRRMNRLWFERLGVCADSNTWPGYVAGVAELDVPDDDVELVFGDEDSNEGDG